MKANRVITSTGGALLLTALLSAGAMPALAEMGGINPVPFDPPVSGNPVPFDPPMSGNPVPFDPPMSGNPVAFGVLLGIANVGTASCTPNVDCLHPQLSVTQDIDNVVVGSPVLFEGSGFEPSEQITIADTQGRFSLSAVADDAGSFRYDWAVPDCAGSGWSGVFHAIGAVSQLESDMAQVHAPQTYVTDGDTLGTLKGWCPGEELTITVDKEYYQTQFASPEGTSSTSAIDELATTITTGVLVEIHGKESGGYHGVFVVPITVNTDPPMELNETPEPKETPKPKTVELTVETPKTELTVETETSVPPVALRPQPQAAVVTNGTDGANLASGAIAATLLAGPTPFLALIVLSLLAFPAALIYGTARTTHTVGAFLGLWNKR